MNKFATLILALTLILTSIAFSQPRQSGFGGTITGHIIDADLQIPLEYANIVLYNQRDSSQVTGTITDQDGNFKLSNIRPGTYYLEFYFMGYETKRSNSIVIKPPDLEVKLDNIFLKQTALEAEGIEVEAESPPMSYKIDKKVINVDQQFASISGTAVDVLENVPSVTVDIEGNVSLRGSSNFRVLIDGRPSVFDANDALQQIPASTIDDIEIITNPSAKYNPEGTAGIINIILKKTQQSGKSGIANLNAGANDKYGGDALFEMKSQSYTAAFGIDYNRRIYTGDSREENRTTRQDITSYVYSDGSSERGRISLGLRGNLELKLNARDLLSFGGRYGDRTWEQNSNLNYDEWSDSAGIHHLYTSTMKRERSGYYYAFNSSYQHRFARKGHELTADMFYSYRNSDEETTNELLSTAGAITSGQRSTESGPDKDFRAKADYALPLGENSKFEAGYQSELDRSEENNNRLEFLSDQNAYVLQPKYSNSTNYDRDIHAAYTMYSGERDNFGYQVGLRGEYTYRTIQFSGASGRFTIDRWDYFPTVHTSYQFSRGQQVMASYTRRIDRPHGWQLEPYETWMDAYNVRVGNPALKPEYIDSYEMGYQTYFGKNLFSTEAYYRQTNNRIERVRSVYDANITLHTSENIGTDNALGSELLLNFDLLKKWNINLMGNLYNYRVEGTLYGEPFSRESFNWNTRLRNSIKIGDATEIQLDGFYNSPSVSSQGRREGFFVTSAALKYEFMEKQLSATLQIRDIFGTAKFERTTEGLGFYTYNRYSREAPIIMLNIRFNYNNYKPERQRNQGNGDTEGDVEF